MALRYSAVFFAALVLYGISSAPGAVWQDSGLFQYRVWHNDSKAREGLALSHPLYHVVAIGAKYIPFGRVRPPGQSASPRWRPPSRWRTCTC